MLGTVKPGGDSNSLSHILFYWTVATVLALGQFSAQRASVGWLVLGTAVALGVSDERKISSLIVDPHPSME